jgi:hypothetical protein
MQAAACKQQHASSLPVSTQTFDRCGSHPHCKAMLQHQNEPAILPNTKRNPSWLNCFKPQ